MAKPSSATKKAVKKKGTKESVKSKKKAPPVKVSEGLGSVGRWTSDQGLQKGTEEEN